jgi:hypothetical protein
MRYTDHQIRKMSFDAIQEVLTDSQHLLLANMIRTGQWTTYEEIMSMNGTPHYQGWLELCSWGVFALDKGGRRCDPLATWRLTRMGAGLARFLADRDAAAA